MTMTMTMTLEEAMSAPGERVAATRTRNTRRPGASCDYDRLTNTTSSANLPNMMLDTEFPIALSAAIVGHGD